MAATAAARTAAGAGVDGWPADRSTTGSPAARRATTASITRITWNGGIPLRRATRPSCSTIHAPATLPAIERAADAPVLAGGPIEQLGVDQIPPQRGDVVRPHRAAARRSPRARCSAVRARSAARCARGRSGASGPARGIAVIRSPAKNVRSTFAICSGDDVMSSRHRQASSAATVTCLACPTPPTSRSASRWPTTPT